MKKLHNVLTLIIVSVLFFQCQKNISFAGNPDPGVPVIPDPIKTSLQGNITDENDQPVTGVTVIAGTSMAVTDANGYFHINNAALDKNTTLITVQKDGYFTGYRVFAATSGCNQVAIKMIRRDLAGTIPSSSGGAASLPGGAKVNLPANGVVVASSNSAYSGDIKVYASYINPTSSDIVKTVPGSFVANDKNGKRVILSSYGMLAVELSSSGGEKLQIKNGSIATLTIPIPVTSLSSAPATIPLWYIEEATGIWKEEGMATKQGSNYIGEVKHFSYWNCDYAYPGVSLSFTLHTPDGLPIANASVQVVPADSSGSGGLAHGYTDSLGQVRGLVPANTSLILEVISPCGTLAYTQNIPPLSQEKDLGIITVNGANSFLLTFTGTLLNCSGTPVTNGYALINFDGTTRYAATDANGQFTTTYVICSGVPASSTVTGVDETTQQQSEPVTVTVTAPATKAGSITACGVSAEQYINYTLDGTDYSITALDSLYGFTQTQGSAITTYIMGSQLANDNEYISFNSEGAASAGTFPVSYMYIMPYGNVILKQPFNVQFTAFPAAPGGFYEGSLSGQFSDTTAAAHNISATFRVRRTN